MGFTLSGIERFSVNLFDQMVRTWFPSTCVICDDLCGEDKLCRYCAEFPPIEGNLCPRCGEPMAVKLVLCGRCQTRPSRIRALRSGFWLDTRSATLVHKIKYQREWEWLDILLAKLPSVAPPAFRGEVEIIPVPLHLGQLTLRLFNQAEALAEGLEKIGWGRLQANGLQKRRRTNPQSQMRLAGRRTNLRGAFEWNERLPIPKRVLLVDDILTTGETLQACAKELHRVGVEEIYGWTFFRTGREGILLR